MRHRDGGSAACSVTRRKRPSRSPDPEESPGFPRKGGPLVVSDAAIAGQVRKACGTRTKWLRALALHWHMGHGDSHEGSINTRFCYWSSLRRWVPA